MRVFVSAKPFAREQKVIKIDDTHFEISVKEPPIQGKANSAISRALAEYFGIMVSRVRLISGYSSRQKVFSIE
jgi:uncharacterized protein